MAVFAANFTIERGTDFEIEFALKDTDGLPFNLTDYRVFSKVKKNRESENFLTFNVGIVNRTQGIILLRLPRWLSINLPFGRCVYDIVVVDFNLNKTVVLEGDIIVEGLVSQNCNFVLPTSAQRLCIAVIDESQGSGHTFESFEQKWNQFRTQFPNRTFYLLKPTNSGFGNIVNDTHYDKLLCPDSFLNETTVNISPLI
jgi:hypothetical protein